MDYHLNVEKMKQALATMHTAYVEMVSILQDIDEPIKKRKLTNADMVDVGFFAREIMNLSDDLRKEAKARTELAGKILCLSTLEDGLTESIKGQYATGIPDGGLVPRVPKPGTPEYEQLCKWLGLPDVTEEQNGLVRFHWKTLKTLMEQAAAEGRALPFTIEATPEFKTVFRKKR